MERRFGPYQLVRQIAAGGMAEIYLARTSGVGGFEKYVALKLIHSRFANDAQFTQRLVDEAKIAVQLNHANIVQTFDLGRVGDTFYITMEYVDGADLFDVLVRCSERQVELPVAVCAHVAKEIARALDHAHGKTARDGTPLGIVHRDVSPHNVLVSRAGEVKLVDFGIAKAATKVFQTATGVIQGKYHYMSPEQASGESIDGRSDVFSAGIVLYEMLTGRMLYREVDLHRLLGKARRADIAPPSRVRAGVPPELERIVMRALARQPADRYQSAAALAADLEQFLRACAPVLYAKKLGELLERVLADHAAPLDVARQRSDIRDDNSVLARLDGGTWPFAGAETAPGDADTLIAPMDDQMLCLDDERATAERPRVAPPANATPTQVAIEIATPTQIMVPHVMVTPPPAVFGIASVQLGVSTPAVGSITRVPGVPAHLLPYVRRDAKPIPRPLLPPMPFAIYSGGVRLFEPYIMPARFVVPAGIKWWKVVVAVVVALGLAYGCARCATEMWAPPPVVSGA
ncbi:MAG TPA: serine/threonine-protein kinase [Kofleriaceae bacterium]|jgi:serine/threonine protein kinase